MKSSIFHLALGAFILTASLPIHASAYTDPGSGAFVYQAAYAAVLAGTFYFRKILNRFWGRRK